MRNWLHQTAGIDAMQSAVLGGQPGIVLTSPTGGGKTKMMIDMVQWANEREWPVSTYTNRKLLLEQTARFMEGAGIEFGTRASGHKPALLRGVQISSIQTEYERCVKSDRWKLHDARLVLVDEIHVQKGEAAKAIFGHHDKAGAARIGFTATPLDLSEDWENLIVAGTTSELRDCGALVPCKVFAPDEPKLKDGMMTRGRNGEYSREQIVAALFGGKAKIKTGEYNGVPQYSHQIFSRVLQNWRQLNPEQTPTILFAPGVPESMWFAREFEKAGIAAAHIDGENVYVDGELHESSQEIREQVLEGSRSGLIKVLCNRFVLREGIDLPHLQCCILATIMGSLTTFLQSVGRLLRAHPSLDHVTLIDHGGNYWRHGSPNADREWQLGQTAYMLGTLREQRLREQTERDPIVCPECYGVRTTGGRCPHCGYKHERSVRMVVQKNGTLKPVSEPIFKPRRITKRANAGELWRDYFHRARNSKNGMTFRQAEALFAKENFWHYPPRTLPLMPLDEADWYRRVRDVAREDLIQPGDTLGETA